MTYKVEDSSFWTSYYNHNREPTKPSPFAIFVSDFIKPKKSLLELGCGNGRDSIFFSTKCKLTVLGIDQIETQIDFLNNEYSNEHLKFEAMDFTTYKNINSVDYVYSRWTIHSISAVQEKKVLIHTYSNLKKNGTFFIEARSIKDDLYGIGKKVQKNAYYTDHYRRFIDMNELEQELKDIGFEILFKKEGRGMAVYKQDDPVILRIIAKKV